jgi:hypothetical protein
MRDLNGSRRKPLKTAEAREALAAFAERRPPQFREVSHLTLPFCWSTA